MPNTYYVRKNGGPSDSNSGTDKDHPWATIDKAANTVVAGDTVYIGAGVYRELVTMDTAGSSGSPITFIGDITGANTGDAGLVIISGFDDDEALAARVCWDMNAKDFIVVQNIQFIGTNSTHVVGNTASASHLSYEGCKFEHCSFTVAGRGGAADAVRIEVNNGATPTNNGLQFNRCLFLGRFSLHWDSNATAMVNLKWLIDSCVFLGSGDPTNGIGFDFARQTNGGANTIGGITITNNTFISVLRAVNGTNLANTTNAIGIYNNIAVLCNVFCNLTTITSGAITLRGNIASGCASASAYAGSTLLTPPVNLDDSAVMLGGLHDFLWRVFMGWSPWLPYEPLSVSGYTNPLAAHGQIQYLQGSTDWLGQVRSLGWADKLSHLYYFDGSDAGTTDPGAVWSNDANAVDSAVSTNASAVTSGSTASNYLMAEGTNAPGSGGTIGTVYVRGSIWISAGSATISVTFYTDALGESLGVISSTQTSQAWTSWTALTTPTGGWTWAKIQALEFKAYRSAGTGTVRLAMLEVSVEAAESAPDIGAIESRNRPIRTSGTVNAGTYAAEFDGAGYHDLFMPVDATSTTVTVYARFDSNYNTAVGKPQLIVYNISGVADQTDTVTVSAGSWEQLSVNFTPTAAGVVRVRLLSRDASTTGKCFFDDLARS